MHIPDMEARIKLTQVKAAFYMSPGIISFFIFAAINNFFDVRKFSDFNVIVILIVELLLSLSLIFGGIMVAYKRYMPRCPFCKKVLHLNDINSAKETNLCVHCETQIVSNSS